MAQRRVEDGVTCWIVGGGSEVMHGVKAEVDLTTTQARINAIDMDRLLGAGNGLRDHDHLIPR